MFNREKLQKTVAALVGAIVLSATFVSAAVGPARAAETAQIVASQAGA